MPPTETSVEQPKRKRGRPRKHPQPPTVQVSEPNDSAGEPSKVGSTDESPELVEHTLAEVNKPSPLPMEKMIPAPGSARPGHKWVYNRLNSPYEIEFDSRPFAWQAHEFREIPTDVAHHLCSWSVLQLPVSGPPVRALALEGKKGYGAPFKTKERPVELIDRSVDANPMGRGTGGIPTKAKVLYLGQVIE
jgi:hypothetical protein